MTKFINSFGVSYLLKECLVHRRHARIRMNLMKEISNLNIDSIQQQKKESFILFRFQLRALENKNGRINNKVERRQRLDSKGSR